MKLQIADKSQIEQIFSLYKDVVEAVAKTSVRLGWNTDIYPSREWIEEEVSKNEKTKEQKLAEIKEKITNIDKSIASAEDKIKDLKIKKLNLLEKAEEIKKKD